MKVQWFLPLTLAVSVAMVGLMKIRKKEQDEEDKKTRFEDIKLKVTHDVLGEYLNEKTDIQNVLDATQREQKIMEEEVKIGQVKADKAKEQIDHCQGGQKFARDELAAVETEFNDVKGAAEKEKVAWMAEVERLKTQLAARSPVCDFLKAGSQAASKLCGNEVIEPPKQEEPKPEPPKQEEPKPEPPKQEEPKPQPPKQEEPKAEAPKQEEPKAEPPKQEEPKAEAPKQEEPKAEAPKQEEPKAEAPKKR